MIDVWICERKTKLISIAKQLTINIDFEIDRIKITYDCFVAINHVIKSKK